MTINQPSARLVVCIDFEPGVPGNDVARAVAQKLGLPLVDREIDVIAAEALHIPLRQVEKLEGEPDHPIRRWFIALGEGAVDIGLTGPTSAQRDPELQPRDELMKAIRSALDVVAARPVVISDHEAAYELRGRADAIGVLLHASAARRARWLADSFGIGLENAMKRIGRLDQDRRAYVRQMYGLTWPDPDLYDLNFDVAELTAEDAAMLILNFVQSRGHPQAR